MHVCEGAAVLNGQQLTQSSINKCAAMTLVYPEQMTIVLNHLVCDNQIWTECSCTET